MSNRAVQRRESLMKARGQHIPGSRPSSFSSPSTPSYAQHPSAAYPVQQPQQNQPPLNAFQQQQLQMQQAQQQQRQMMQQQQHQPIINTVTAPAVQPQVTSATPVTTSFMTYETFLELYQKQSDENAKQTQALISCINELKTGIVDVVQSSQQIATDQFQQEKEKNDKMFNLFKPAHKSSELISTKSTDKDVPKTQSSLSFAGDSLPVAVPFTPSAQPVKPYDSKSLVYVPLTPSYNIITEGDYSLNPQTKLEPLDKLISADILEIPEPQEFKIPEQSESPLKESLTVSPVFEVTSVSIVPPVV